MGLLEDLQAVSKRETTCLLKTVFDTLSEEEQEALRTALENVKKDERSGKAKQYSTTWLSDVLTANGHPISRSSVSRHLSGVCSCEFPL